MVRVEERGAVRHVRVAGDDSPDGVALQLGRRLAEAGRNAGQRLQVVVDDDLAGDRHDFAEGSQRVGLLRVRQRRAMELALLVHLGQRRNVAQLHPVDGLEVRGRHLAAERYEGARRGLIRLAQRLVGDVRQDVGEVAGGHHAALEILGGAEPALQSHPGDVVAAHAPRLHAGSIQALAGDVHQRQAGVLAARPRADSRRRDCPGTGWPASMPLRRLSVASAPIVTVELVGSVGWSVN